MARVHLKQPDELTGDARKAYEALEAAGKVTNMKLVMLQDYGTYKAFMGWYDSWASLEKAIGLRAATIYAHAVSTTNGCMLCSLFFISDLRELGLDPNSFETTENEKLLQQLGQQIVKDPTKVSDELLNGLRKFYTDEQDTSFVIPQSTTRLIIPTVKMPSWICSEYDIIKNPPGVQETA